MRLNLIYGRGAMVKVERATEMGFCFGVKRALEIVGQAAQEGSLQSLGAIVHNRQVVKRLESQGVGTIRSLDELSGRRVAISSHGVGPETVAEMERRHLQVIDATCPYVRKAQATAQRLVREGFSVIIFGERDHPEVRGVLGWAQGRGIATTDPVIASKFAELYRGVGILSQTTQSPPRYLYFVEQMRELCRGRPAEAPLLSIDTICDSTRRRQAAALELAARVDMVVVVGGRDSANTRRLAETCAAAGATTYHVETAAELEPSWLHGRRRMGVTAGASTPDEVINEVIARLEGMLDN